MLSLYMYDNTVVFYSGKNNFSFSLTFYAYRFQIFKTDDDEDDADVLLKPTLHYTTKNNNPTTNVHSLRLKLFYLFHE